MNNKKEIFQNLLFVLRKIESDARLFHADAEGICNMIYMRSRRYEEHALLIFKAYAKSWTHYSGNRTYPIPNTPIWYKPSTWFRSPVRCYYDVKATHRWSGKQKELRLSLIRFVITHLEHDLETGEFVLLEVKC